MRFTFLLRSIFLFTLLGLFTLTGCEKPEPIEEEVNAYGDKRGAVQLEFLPGLDFGEENPNNSNSNEALVISNASLPCIDDVAFVIFISETDDIFHASYTYNNDYNGWVIFPNVINWSLTNLSTGTVSTLSGGSVNFPVQDYHEYSLEISVGYGVDIVNYHIKEYCFAVYGPPIPPEQSPDPENETPYQMGEDYPYDDFFSMLDCEGKDPYTPLSLQGLGCPNGNGAVAVMVRG